MVLAGFFLAVVVTGGEHQRTGEPSVSTAVVTQCAPGQQEDDPCTRT